MNDTDQTPITGTTDETGPDAWSVTPEQAARLEVLSNELQRHAFTLPEKYNGLEVVRAMLATSVALCRSTGLEFDMFLQLVDDAVLMTTPPHERTELQAEDREEG